MLDTGWKLTLKNAASTPARKITRDLLALTSALNGLSSASSSAQAALSRVAPAGTAVQVRGVTSAIREQTKALRDQASVAGRSGGRAPRSGVAARAPSLAGRTRLDVAAGPAGATRQEGASARDIAAGVAFQQRALNLQARYRERVGAQQVRQNTTNLAQQQRANQGYFQRLSRMTQQSFRENERLRAQQRRNTERDQRARAAGEARAYNAQGNALLGFAGAAAGALAGVLAIGAGIASTFAEVGLSAARAVVEVASFRESSLVALEAVLGSSQAAGRQFRNAVTVANQTPLDTQDVIAQTQSFAIAGFGEREIAPLVAASADLGAAFGQRSSEGFALALSQIRAAGRLQGQELLQLSNANVSRSAILDSIARQMNLGEGEVGRRAAQRAITERRVTSGVGEQAALDAVRGRLDQGGQLGSFARRQSETLTGALSNARNAVFNLLVGIDFANVPGLIAFKNVLLQITGALTTGSPAAAALRQGMMGAANAVGGLLARAVNPQSIATGMAMVGRGIGAIQRFGAAALPVVRAFAQGFGPAFLSSITPLRTLFASLTSGGAPSARTLAALATAAQGLGRVFGMVLGTITSVVGAVTLVAGVTTAAGVAISGLVGGVTARLSTWGAAVGAALLGPIVSIGTSLYTAFTGVGGQIVTGIIAGITGGVASMGTAITNLGASAIASARAALGIRSPSRVFADVIGRQIPAGIAMGVDAHAGLANDAVSGIVSPRVPQLGGGGASVTIEINVTGGAQPQETARAIRTEIEDALGGIFGQWSEALA